MCQTEDLDETNPMPVEIDGVEIAIVKAEDEIFAIRDECSHAEIPLSEGEIDGCTIECWLHGSRFDLRTGKPSGPPATEPVDTFEVRIDGNNVLISLEPPSKEH